MFRHTVFPFTVMKIKSGRFLIIFVATIMVIKLLQDSKTEFTFQLSNENFLTAMGIVPIEEITKNVFKPNGYILVKNELIPFLRKKNLVTCNNVFLSWQDIADNGLTVDPPKVIPDPENFLLHGYSQLFHMYFNETPQNTKASIQTWSKAFIDEMIETAERDPTELKRSYNKESLSVAVHAATSYYNINGQVGAVIGSQTPWAEVYCLANSAKHVTTVDYRKYIIQHPQMSFLYAPDLPVFRKEYYNKFDFVVSFSSIEHSGLGRYGDPIDSIGDIREMNKIHCMLKPKGLLFLGLPVGVDSIFYNAHRIYGRIRLAMMFEGFRLLNIFREDSIVVKQSMRQIFTNKTHVDQYLFVLEKV